MFLSYEQTKKGRIAYQGLHSDRKIASKISSHLHRRPKASPQTNQRGPSEHWMHIMHPDLGAPPDRPQRTIARVIMEKGVRTRGETPRLEKARPNQRQAPKGSVNSTRSDVNLPKLSEDKMVGCRPRATTHWHNPTHSLGKMLEELGGPVELSHR